MKKIFITSLIFTSLIIISANHFKNISKVEDPIPDSITANPVDISTLGTMHFDGNETVNTSWNLEESKGYHYFLLLTVGGAYVDREWFYFDKTLNKQFYYNNMKQQRMGIFMSQDPFEVKLNAEGGIGNDHWITYNDIPRDQITNVVEHGAVDSKSYSMYHYNSGKSFTYNNKQYSYNTPEEAYWALVGLYFQADSNVKNDEIEPDKYNDHLTIAMHEAANHPKSGFQNPLSAVTFDSHYPDINITLSLLDASFLRNLYVQLPDQKNPIIVKPSSILATCQVQALYEYISNIKVGTNPISSTQAPTLYDNYSDCVPSNTVFADDIHRMQVEKGDILELSYSKDSAFSNLYQVYLTFQSNGYSTTLGYWQVNKS